MRFRICLALLCAILVSVSLIAAGCANGRIDSEPGIDPSRSGSEKVDLLVFAAASMSDSLKKIEPIFEEQYPYVNVSFNLAASGTLQRQIEQGAPADVFISAGVKQMNALVEQQFIRKEDVRRFLGNELVVIVPYRSKYDLDGLDRLHRDEFKRIAVGQPETVPAGQYAKQSLSSAGIWESISAKLVYGKDVRSVLTFVETENADAGFVFRTDAKSNDKVKIAFVPSADGYDPAVYPAVLINRTSHPEEAEAFIQLLQEEEAMKIFTDMGFADLR